jgi:hypothetical protein
MTDANLKHLASLSKSLNEASDTLSKQITQVEAALNELNLGIWAWVVLGKYVDDETFRTNGNPESVTRVEHLGYGKHQGKWGILFAVDYDEYPDPELGAVWFLRDAPRMNRIKAVEKLPELIKALETEAAEVTEEATKKATQVRELASALRKTVEGV